MDKNTFDSQDAFVADFPGRNVEDIVNYHEQAFAQIFEAMADLLHYAIDEPHRNGPNSPGIAIEFKWRVRRKQTEYSTEWSSNSGAGTGTPTEFSTTMAVVEKLNKELNTKVKWILDLQEYKITLPTGGVGFFRLLQDGVDWAYDVMSRRNVGRSADGKS